MRLPPACRRFLSVLLAKKEDELNAYVRGPLFPRRVFVVLIGLFVASSMLTADWFGLLLLNAGGVARQIGILYTLRVTSVLLGAVSFSSLLLAAHYARLYTYTSEENVFFTTCFALSFLLGFPCALTWVFG